MNCVFQGADGSHRLARDWDTVAGNTQTSPNVSLNVVTPGSQLSTNLYIIGQLYPNGYSGPVMRAPGNVFQLVDNLNSTSVDVNFGPVTSSYPMMHFPGSNVVQFVNGINSFYDEVDFLTVGSCANNTNAGATTAFLVTCYAPLISPSFTTPNLGTPSAINLANGTNLPSASVNATPLPTPGTSITLAIPRGYAICTSTCTVTIPVPAAGYEFCAMNDDNVSTVITLAAIGSSAHYENTARTAYGTAGTGTLVSGGAVGDKVCILGRDATHYLTATFNGTWTAN